MNKHTRGQRIGCLICIVSAALMVVLTVAVVRYATTHLRPAEESQDIPCPVVSAAAPKTVDIQGFCAPAKAAPDMTCPVGTVPVLETYTDGDAPVPEWWNPEEPMAAVWSAVKTEDMGEIWGEYGENMESQQNPNPSPTESQSDTVDYIAHPPVGIDPGGVDWNIETEIVGWDGHRMAVWEMDLFSRIIFLEFGISSQECREAGIDAILRLWESEYYSSTLFGTVSAVAENGRPAFSTYPGVWEEEYDYEKLAQIREDCEERFLNGPVWIAPFFRLDHYHDWAVPCYELDGVYFSTSPYLH